MALLPMYEDSIENIYKECNTTEGSVKEDVEVLRKWLQQQPHLLIVDDHLWLEGLLIQFKCSAERVKQFLTMYATVRADIPEFYSCRDPLDNRFNTMLQVVNISYLPRVTADGYRGIVMKVSSSNTRVFDIETLFTYIFMLGDILSFNDKLTGDFFICDLEMAGLEFLAKLTFPIVRKSMVVTNCRKSRLKGLHIVNPPPFIDALMAILKTVLKSVKMVNRLHVHADMDSLYKHVDRKLLPKDYGGEEKSIAELSADCKAMLESRREWFLEQAKLDAENAKRQPEKANDTADDFGLHGTFKRLNVD